MNTGIQFVRGYGCMTMIMPLLFAFGCGPARRPDVAPVAGYVAIDGRPVMDGDIRFDSDDPHRSPTGARIKQGRYSGEAPVGRNRVSTTASGTSPASPVVDGERLPVNIIPARYNEQTKLHADIPAGGISGLDFTLTAD